MADGLMSRVGGWFRRGNRAADAAGPDAPVPGTTELVSADDRPSLLRPFARRDNAIQNLQKGFESFNGLIGTINTNLQDQGRRQDELIGYLSHLPEAIKGIPETNRLQVESLKAISARLDQQSDLQVETVKAISARLDQQGELQVESLKAISARFDQQSEQQGMIVEVLGKMADNDVQQRQTTEAVRDRMEAVAEQNKNIAENLTTVGEAMQTVSQSTSASTEVLTQLRDNFDRRDGQIERILHKQASRFTVLLVVAIALSVAALVAVGVVGYQLMNRPAVPATSTR